MTAVKEVLSNDKNIRIVYREFPILSEGSIFASRAALASRAQNKYKVFHEEPVIQNHYLLIFCMPCNNLH